MNKHRRGPFRSALAACASLVLVAGAARADNLPMTVIIGMDEAGRPIHPPSDSPASSWTRDRPWNGRSLRYNAVTRRLAFEIFDTSIKAGERPRSDFDQGDTSRLAAVPITSIVYHAATAAHDPLYRDKTKELYISEADGTGAVCISGHTLVDGQDGVMIFSAPYANGTRRFRREMGKVIYDVQNKDHASWYPNGDWIAAAVEMPVHPGQHGLAAAGTGSFTDLWAVYGRQGDPRFGKIWVQLTDWARGWKETGLYDPIAMAPYNASQKQCPAGTQYATSSTEVPFGYFHGSPLGQPPPVSGVMRITVSESLQPDGNALIAWGAKVGFLRPSGASVVFLGRAEFHLSEAGIEGVDLKLPSLVDVQCPLAPTPAHPDGVGTYRGRQFPGGLGTVGQLYEPWAFSPDNQHLLIASDVFASGRPGPGKTSPDTFYFMDVMEYATDGSGLKDLTAYNPAIGYGYPLNDRPPPMNTWGFWEEASTYITWRGHHYMAFCSNAGFPHKDIGLDTWLLDLDHPKIRQITATNDPRTTRATDVVYPTSWDGRDGLLFVTRQNAHYYQDNDKKKDPTGYGNALAPADQLVINLGEALDRGLMR